MENVPVSSDDTLKRLDQQEAIIIKALVSGHTASTVMACAWWNIKQHRLYASKGFKSMSAYIESIGASRDTVKKQLQRAEAIASVEFDATTPDEARWLKEQHAVVWCAAEKERRLITRESRMALLSDGQPTKGAVDLDGELNADVSDDLAQEYKDLYRAKHGRKKTRGIDEAKRSKRSEQAMKVDAVISASEALALQIYHAQQEGLLRSGKKLDEVMYLAQLAWWFILNPLSTNAVFSGYKDAVALLKQHNGDPNQLPDSIKFALKDVANS